MLDKEITSHSVANMNETGPNGVIRTAIVEDMRDIREGLGMLINFTEGFELTGNYRSMEEAIPRIKGNVPDVLLSDIGLPGMNGIEGVRILKELYPGMTVLDRKSVRVGKEGRSRW